MNILHVAQVDVSRSSGMGRVAWHWREELERRGHRFVHLGRAAIGRTVHPAWYPLAAWKAAQRLAPTPDLVLAHEPAAAMFATRRRPLIAFSHGLERRGWSAARRYQAQSGERIRLRSRILFPVWRLLACDYAMKNADGALVLNQEDLAYCLSRYARSRHSTFLFRNGIDPATGVANPDSAEAPAVLFMGSWLARKGVKTLVAAARLLSERGVHPRWLLIGTGAAPEDVRARWPDALRERVEVVPTFEPHEESDLIRRATLFILPSFFEGQPLALLQAMASGLAVIASDTCGQRDLVIHGENGLLFAPGDAAALAERIAQCLLDGQLRSRLGAAARRSVAGRSWQRVAAEVADFVERVYAESRRASAA